MNLNEFLAKLFRTRAKIISESVAGLNLNPISAAIARAQVREYEELAELLEQV